MSCHPNRTMLVVLSLFAAVALAGCGGAEKKSADPPAPSAASTPDGQEQPSASPSPADIDPCSLVTKTEADKIAGVTLRPPVRAMQTCTFATPTSGPTRQLEVFLGDGVKKFLDIDRQLGHEFRTVTGLGDEAYAETGVIFFRMGVLWVSLRLLRLDTVDTGPPLEALARTVAGRI